MGRRGLSGKGRKCLTMKRKSWASKDMEGRGQAKKGRKCHTMKQKRGVATMNEDEFKQKSPKTPYSEVTSQGQLLFVS
jgi:hypothetical protein